MHFFFSLSALFYFGSLQPVKYTFENCSNRKLVTGGRIWGRKKNRTEEEKIVDSNYTATQKEGESDNAQLRKKKLSKRTMDFFKKANTHSLRRDTKRRGEEAADGAGRSPC